MELNTDDIDITGVPDDADPSQLTNKLDYSNPEQRQILNIAYLLRNSSQHLSYFVPLNPV